jgi:sirohydrochlorin ferrochelatase
VAANKALLIVAHGSSRAFSNEEVRQLTEKMTTEAQGHFNAVRCAFLELAEPSIPDGLRGLINDGFDDIIVVPYFLSAGRHVAEDIPGEVKTIATEYPDAKINIAPHLGVASGVIKILLGQALD